MKRFFVFLFTLILIGLLASFSTFGIGLSNNKVETSSFVAIVDFIDFSGPTTKVTITVVNRTNSSLFFSWIGNNSYIQTSYGTTANFVKAEGINVGTLPLTEVERNSSIRFVLHYDALPAIPNQLSIFEGTAFLFGKRLEFNNIQVSE
jgi:hypothetical protein